jgi:hypothetical protein
LIGVAAMFGPYGTVAMKSFLIINQYVVYFQRITFAPVLEAAVKGGITQH